MLAGLFLSKFDREGLRYLGLSSFAEAYNAMGFALGGKPTSIKNYMQEFDPLFPNHREGWHGRPVREHCREAFGRYGDLRLEEFARLLSPLLLRATGPLHEEMAELAGFEEEELASESFSKRLITGAAAEGYFESSWSKLPDFAGHTLANVTRAGCGFDFLLRPADPGPFLAVEVKGLSGTTGEVMLTSKEHRVATHLQNRYFLCVVRNFSERPVLSIFRNPLNNGLEFIRRERHHKIHSWHVRITA